jgi:cathepsin D
VGNTQNSFKVVYDTGFPFFLKDVCLTVIKGSANIWINSEQCTDEGCTSHKQYKSSDSKTFKQLGYGLDVEFGTGELLGEINADNVYIAGVQVDSQNFAEITHEIGDIFADVLTFFPYISHYIFSLDLMVSLDFLIQVWRHIKWNPFSIT